MRLEVLRVSDAAAPSASEQGDETPVLCHAPAPGEGDEAPIEAPVLCHATAPEEGDDAPVLCHAPAPGEDDAEAADTEVADFAPPLGLAERWRHEVGDAPGGTFEQVWRELKTFLVSCSTSTTPQRPTAQVDVLWHEFILFTHDYHAFCKHLGGYVHHAPEVAGTASA